MKLRIQGDSVRLRLSRSEVEVFAAVGRVADAVHFGSRHTLTYVLKIDLCDAMHADFGDGTLTVFVPQTWAQTWASSDRVGFEESQAMDEGRTLRLLVEKDFDCLHKRPDEDDLFAHPLADPTASSDGE